MQNFAASPHLILARALTGNSQRAAFVTDTRGLVLLFTPAAGELLGYPPREVVRRFNAALFFDPIELAVWSREIARATGEVVAVGFEVFVQQARLNQTFAREWVCYGKDGVRTPTHIEVSAAHDEEGNLYGFAFFLQAVPVATQERAEAFPGQSAPMLAPVASSPTFSSNAHPASPASALVGPTSPSSAERAPEPGAPALLKGGLCTLSNAEMSALRESEAYYRAVVSGMQEGVVLQDANGMVRTCNPSAERMLGLTLAQMNDPYLPGAPWDMIDERGLPLPPARYPLSNARQTGQLCANNVMGVRQPSGEVTWLLLNTRPLVLEEGNAEPAVLMSFTDISERKRFEVELAHTRDAALESAQLKSAFLANVSHEIRTPLNGIVGIIDLLGRTPLIQEQQNFLHSLDVSAEALLSLINELLDLAKLEADKSHLELAEFEVRALFEDVLELLAPRVQPSNVELLLWLDDTVPPRLSGDAGRLRQILMNLLSNALKFTDAGEVVVRATVQSETSVGITLAVEVQDTGIGLSPEAQTRVFDPFWQNEVPSGKRTGTGLGLAISRQLAELMGGQLWVRSMPESGSTFGFSVRLQKVASASQEQAVPPSWDKRRVLVVDDNATSRELLEYLLGQWGLSVTAVPSGRDALDALEVAQKEEAPFEALLLDQLMPDMGGAELACALRSEAAYQSLPLLMLTAVSSEEDSCRNADVCVAKPLRAARLKRALQEILPSSLTESIPPEPHPQIFVAPTPLPVTASDSWPAELRVLLVEDNPINQQVAASQLALLGCTFEIAHNGREALDIWERGHYRVMLLDCQLPYLDGYAVTEEIRRREAERGLSREPATYIIAITAHAMPEDRERCLACGMDDYLSKPVKTAALQMALDRWRQSLVSVPVIASASGETKGKLVLAPSAHQYPGRTATNTVFITEEELAPDLVIDPAMLEGLRRSAAQGDLLQEMVALFLADAPTRWSAIEEATAAQDWSLAARQAHALSGSGSHFGTARLMRACAFLESAVRQGQYGTIPDLVRQIGDELSRVQNELRSFD